MKRRGKSIPGIVSQVQRQELALVRKEHIAEYAWAKRKLHQR